MNISILDNITDVKNICFTGPRPVNLCGYDPICYTQLNMQVKAILKALIEKGAVNFISGGAQGFDQFAFWMVNALKKEYPNIKNSVYIPFNGQESQWRNDGLFGKSDYRKMLKHADNTNIITKFESYPDANQVVKVLFNRNEAMVNDADLVIALYPGDTWTKAKGGTAGCMRYAYKTRKPILQLNFNKNTLCISDLKIIK